MAEIHVMRIGHRLQRDKRITTHVCLVARAFGACRAYVDRRDPKIESTIKSVNERFGGSFEVSTGVSWRRKFREFQGIKVHLTMYGTPLEWVLDALRAEERVMVIVGAEKVPAEVYRQSDYNVGVGAEPHSEVAALAVFLDRLRDAHWSHIAWPNARMMVIPNPRGKRVIHGGYMEEHGLSKYSDEDAIELLNLLNAPEGLVRHAQAVRDLAVKIGERIDGADVGLIALGGVLHDIGRLRTHSIWHAYVGSVMVSVLGYDGKVGEMVKRHIGAGITRDEAERVGLPPVDYMPRSLEERIVAHSDNLIRGERKVPLSYSLQRLKNASMDPAMERVRALHEELSHLAGIDLDEI